MWQRRITPHKTSLTSSDMRLSGADYSSTHYAFDGSRRLSVDWIGCCPMWADGRRVSEKGRFAAIRAWVDTEVRP